MLQRVRLGLIHVLLGAIALGATGCAKEDTSQPADDSVNILLIVVDTLRADKLGCYGSDLGASPRIDALAAEGIRFDRAYAHAPWTLPSFASILTSLYPPQHRAGGWVGQFRKLPDSIRTLAECFRDAGYATAAIINVDFITKPFGMTQGFTDVDFETYPSNTEVRSADRTTDAALQWLGRPRTKPFFLMVHYFDPHLVYAPPPEYRKRFAAPEDRDDPAWVFGTREQIVGHRQGKVSFDDATILRAEKLYNGEIAATDHEVGRLLDELATRGLDESTIVVFTADHGEEFLDHGGFEHGHTLYDELVHTPLIVRYPGRLQPGVINTAVGHVDIGPTLCELADVEPDPAFAGRSLAASMEGSTEPDHPVILEGNFWGPPIRGWIQGGHKLVYARDGVKLFNLRDDPLEKHDLSQTDPERLHRMLEDMKLAYKGMTSHVSSADASAQLTPEELARLQSLGYVP